MYRVVRWSTFDAWTAMILQRDYLILFFLEKDWLVLITDVSSRILVTYYIWCNESNDRDCFRYIWCNESNDRECFRYIWCNESNDRECFRYIWCNESNDRDRFRYIWRKRFRPDVIPRHYTTTGTLCAYHNCRQRSPKCASITALVCCQHWWRSD